MSKGGGFLEQKQKIGLVDRLLEVKADDWNLTTVEERWEESMWGSLSFDIFKICDWWQRRWVIQEVLYSTKFMFVCGQRTFSWGGVVNIQYSYAYFCSTAYIQHFMQWGLRSVWDLAKLRSDCRLYQRHCTIEVPRGSSEAYIGT